MTWNCPWVVLVGGYSGDGSAVHKLFRNKEDRVATFNSRAHAEKYAKEHAEEGKYCLIAEIIGETQTNVEIVYRTQSSGQRDATKD